MKQVALSAIIAAFIPSVVQAQPPQLIVDGPAAFFVDNPCLAGEVVAVEGRQMSTVYARFGNDGALHFTIRFVAKGKGLTPSTLFQPAKEYVFNSEAVHQANAPASGTAEETIVLNWVLVRRAETDGQPLETVPEDIGVDALLVGTGEDFMLKQTAHITWINGFPRVAFDKVRATCM